LRIAGDRPGFTAFRRDTTADRSVSHVLIHLTDRFARPELASRATLLEQEMLLAGLTVVFSNRTSLPRRRGERNVGEDLQMMFAYSESGEYLDKLAVRMIQTQANLARKGHWTGGQAPYGFARVRVMADGSVQEMEHGTSIRQPRVAHGNSRDRREQDPHLGHGAALVLREEVGLQADRAGTQPPWDPESRCRPHAH
jgi:hypothetical protein